MKWAFTIQFYTVDGSHESKVFNSNPKGFSGLMREFILRTKQAVEWIKTIERR